VGPVYACWLFSTIVCLLDGTRL